jgi:hypothetical protein
MRCNEVAGAKESFESRAALVEPHPSRLPIRAAMTQLARATSARNRKRSRAIGRIANRKCRASLRLAPRRF